MDKLRMQSFDKTGDNIKKIASLFPQCVTERMGKDGKPELAIDFEKLKNELSDEVIDEGEERYQFTWPNKKAAEHLANTPTTMTLRPCREESLDFDTTQNLYIEGDNLEVLKVLRETYLGKVKMIYIDPPYNTGNDFVYNDDFAQSAEEYKENSGQLDEEGNRMVLNTESNGRFHTDWLNMIYPRLRVARDLLSNDGVIFISIDDNEIENLRKICDEIFGEQNFIAQLIWKRRVASALSSDNVSLDHEYVLCFQKSKCNIFRGLAKDYSNYKNPDDDPRGPWIADNLTVGMTASMRPNQAYDLVNPKTGKIYPYNPNRVWAFIPESMEQLIADNRIIFPDDTSKRPMQKRFKNELKKSFNPFSSLMQDLVGLNTEATRIIQEVLGGNVFDYSKPISLLRTLIEQVADGNSLVLDFFSGSATTAHAVMQLNAEDGGNRKFIMVQLPEKTNEKSEAYKDGYKNICEIGKERIRRAGKKIKGESPLTTQNLDTGFRVLKLDSSNMNDVYYTPEEFSQYTLFSENVKQDRTSEDLLFQVMLDLGIELSARIEKHQIAGKEIYLVDGNYLVACFDSDVDETAITEMAKMRPVYFVMRDSSRASDSVADNFEQLFKCYSPDTICKVL